MTTLLSSDESVIGRFRVEAGGEDALAAQNAVSSALRLASFVPPGLPAAAVLCVRKLTDPGGGRWWHDRRRVGVPWEWERAVRAALEREAAAAARPALYPVPPSANGVLFLDRSEMLACLARDWVSGELARNWWWVELLRNRDPALAIPREWERSPESIPAALEILAARGECAAFVEKLPEAWVLALLRLVLEAHRTPVPRFLTASWLDAEESLAEEGGVGAGESRAAGVAGAVRAGGGAGRVADPWGFSVPEATATALTPMRRILLGYALMLRRAPAAARTSEFRRKVEAWHARYVREIEYVVPRRAPPRVEEHAARPGAEVRENVAGEDARAALAPLARAPEIEPARRGDVPLDVGATVTRSAPLEMPGGVSEGAVETPAVFDAVAEAPALLERETVEAQTERPADLTVEADVVEEIAHQPMAPHAVELRPVARTSESAFFDTAFGGIFFLLNAALFLGLYRDFSSPEDPGIELNIWDFLALLGLEFTGGEMRRDAAWTLLADLAGRPAFHNPDERFEPQGWQAPAEWVEAPLREPEETWVHWVARYLRARTAQALGREDAADFLCAKPARVSLTPTRLNVFFGLNEHPIEIRMAGLDRDPGWIPAAGRYVAFHFD